MRDSPDMVAHPVVQRQDYQTLAVPISLHGDGVPITGQGKAWGQSVDAFSWRSILSTGTTLMTNFLIFFIWKFLKCTGGEKDTYEKFWVVLCWSLRALWLGQWPATDWSGEPYPPGSREARRAGQPLAGGYFCTLWCIRADLDFLSSTLGLSSASSRQPCACCRANSTDLPWTDHRPESAWRATIWRNPQWRVEHPGRMQLFHLPGVGIRQVHPDLMHVKHLGTDPHFYGSVLQFLTHHMMPGSPEENLGALWVRVSIQKHPSRCEFLSRSMLRGTSFYPEASLPSSVCLPLQRLHHVSLAEGWAAGSRVGQGGCQGGPAGGMPGTPEENLAALWVPISEAYSRGGATARFGSLRVSMYSKPMEFAHLKGKASELRHFGPALLAAFDSQYDREDRTQRQMRLGLQYSIRIEEILDENADAWRLSDEAAALLQTTIQNFLTIQTALGRHFQAQGLLLFHTTIKSHYLLHIGLNSARLNPRLSWCYSGEDMMQRVRKLIQGAQGGTPPDRIVGKVMDKYAMALAYAIFGSLWR